MNFSMPPDRTISRKAMIGRKKDKHGLRNLFCTHANRSEKYFLLMIGNAHRPKCFQKKFDSERGFQYEND